MPATSLPQCCWLSGVYCNVSVVQCGSSFSRVLAEPCPWEQRAGSKRWSYGASGWAHNLIIQLAVDCLVSVSFIVHTFLCKEAKQLLFVFFVLKKAWPVAWNSCGGWNPTPTATAPLLSCCIFQAVWLVNIPYNIDSTDSVYFLHHILPEDILDIILKGTTVSRNQIVNYSRSIEDFTTNIQESTMMVCHISFKAVQKVMFIKCQCQM